MGQTVGNKELMTGSARRRISDIIHRLQVAIRVVFLPHSTHHTITITLVVTILMWMCLRQRKGILIMWRSMRMTHSLPRFVRVPSRLPFHYQVEVFVYTRKPIEVMV